MGGDLPPNSLQIAEGLPCWSCELLSTLFSRVSCCPLVGLFPGLPAVGRRPSPPPLQRQPWLSDKGGAKSLHSNVCLPVETEVYIRCLPLFFST